MLGKKVHSYIYMISLCLIVLFMPISEYMTSVSQFLLITNFLLELDYKEKLKKLWANKDILIFLLLFLIPVIWLLFTENFSYASNDIRIKLSLLALPVIIGASPVLSKEKTNIILVCFMCGVFISTFIGFLAYHNVILNIDVEEVRNISLFVSHIRLSLMISLSILIISFWIYNGFLKNKITKIIGLAFIVWFLYFLSLIQGFTGIVTLIAAGFFILLTGTLKTKNKTKKYIFLFLAILIPIITLTYLGIEVKKFYTPTSSNEIKTYTSKGNVYDHVKELNLLENGNHVFINISKKEIFEDWPIRSEMDIKGKDKRGQSLYITLLRYMTSKGLAKDSEGMAQLTDEDIRNIEDGEANYKYVDKKSISQRLYTIIWQLDAYKKTGDPSGQSLSQRIEYQKVGIELFLKNFWFGTGTGDLDDSYKAFYEEIDSPLELQYRHRAHNQFLTFFITFGIIGGILCLLAWFYPALKNWDYKNYFFIVFFVIATISMFSDDMLETSTGVVFISFFYSLFLWGRK